MGPRNWGLPSVTLRQKLKAELFVCDTAACLNTQNRHMRKAICVVRAEEWDKCGASWAGKQGVGQRNHLFRDHLFVTIVPRATVYGFRSGTMPVSSTC